jgi:hypothetical protein
MVEIGDDCTEHPEAPEVVLAGQALERVASGEAEQCRLAMSRFGYHVRLHRRAAFRHEEPHRDIAGKGRGVRAAGIPELASAQRARDAPPEQLASQDRRRFPYDPGCNSCRLRWRRGDEPAR